MSEELTPRPAEALEHIKRRIENGLPPTAGELASDMGYNPPIDECAHHGEYNGYGCLDSESPIAAQKSETWSVG